MYSNEEFEALLHVRDIKGHSTIGNSHLVSHSTGLNYNLIAELGMDVSEVLKNHSDSEVKPQSASSIVISAAVTAYARIIITKHKLEREMEQ